MAKNSFHYGWVITIACGLMLFSSIGIAFNTFSIFIDPLADKIDLNRTQSSSLISMITLAGLIAIFISSSLYSKYSVRRIALFAGLLISVGYFILMCAGNYLLLLVGTFIIGAGYGSFAMIPVSILISRWFDKKNGMALGFATAATGISTFILSPIATLIMEGTNLEIALLSQSIFSMIIAICVFLIVKNFPSDKGMKPYGFNEKSVSTAIVQEKPNYFSKRFIAISASCLLLGFTIAPTFGHIAPLLLSLGYDPIFTSIIISVYGAAGIPGNIVAGILIDKIGIIKSNFIIGGIWAMAILMVFLIDGGIFTPILFAIFVGFGAPIGTICVSIWTSDLFQPQYYTRSLSFFQAMLVLGATVGGIIPGVIFDSIGSYVPTYYIYIVFVIIGLTLVQLSYYLYSTKSRIRK